MAFAKRNRAAGQIVITPELGGGDGERPLVQQSSSGGKLSNNIASAWKIVGGSPMGVRVRQLMCQHYDGRTLSEVKGDAEYGL